MAKSVRQDQFPGHAEVLSGLWTLGFLMKLFRRSELTITIWKDRKALPYVVIPGDGRPSIRFRPEAVVEWAKKHKKEMYLPVNKILRRERLKESVDVGSRGNPPRLSKSAA